MHRKTRWYIPALLVAASAVGMAAPSLVRTVAFGFGEAQVRLARQSLAEDITLAHFSDSFQQVAMAVEPSVVHVERYSRRASNNASNRPSVDAPEFDWLPQGMAPRSPSHRVDAFDAYNQPRLAGNGSGWVYDSRGHIVTNYHVVEGGDAIRVRFADGSQREAQLVGADPSTDIAVLRVDGMNLVPAERAVSPVRKGQIVFAFGSPFGNEFSVSQGIVSAMGRQLYIVDDGNGYENFIQTDAAINPGNSGGPLTNVHGDIVGMNTAIASRTGAYNGLGFAIPAAMVENVVDQLIDQGHVTRGYLGVYIRNLDDKLASTFEFSGRGVLVKKPIADSPAQRAGVRHGDIITLIDGQSVGNSNDLRNIVAGYAPGSEMTLSVFREGRYLQLRVLVHNMPEDTPVIETSPPPRPQGSPSSDTSVLRKLGLEALRTYTPEGARRIDAPFVPGVLIQGVRPSSIAAFQGISSRSVITHVMDEPVRTVDELLDSLSRYDLYEGVRVTYQIGDIPSFAVLELPEMD